MNREDAQTLIKYINETDYEPTDWENTFIESILKWPKELTEKQTACLQKIYEKATEKGY